MTKPQWWSDPSLEGIDKTKLEFLQMLVSEGKNLSPAEMLPFFMNIGKRTSGANISFTDKEADAIITLLKKNSSPQETEKIEKIIKLFRKNKKG